MAKIKTFKEILVWQKAHKLTLEIYEQTKTFPDYEKFALANQLRKCSYSVPSNIAEGFKRRHLNDRLHFYNMAEGSLEELKYQLLLARDLRYFQEEIYVVLLRLADEVGKMLHSWMQSQK